MKGKRIKVAWLHSHFHNWMGGTIFIYQVIKRMRETLDVTVFVESASDFARQQFADIEVSVIETTGVSSDNPKYWLFLTRFLKKNYTFLADYIDDFDVVITSMFPMNWLAAKFNKPHVQYCYEPFAHFFDDDMIDSMPLVHRAARKLLRALYSKLDIEGVRKADRILTLSDKNAVWIKDVYGRAGAKVTYEGVDTDYFRPLSDPALQQKYAGRNIVMHSTDFSPIKGTEYLIKAMSEVVKHVPDCLLLITSTMAGTGRQNVLNAIKQSGLEKNVSLLGFLESEDVPKYYTLADVVVQPSINQSMSLSVKEAMACQTPVIRSLDSVEEVIDGESGFLVDPKDSPALAEAIVKILRDPALAERMGRAGRTRIIELFSWESVTAKIADEIKSVYAAGSRPDYIVRELKEGDGDLLYEFFLALSDNAKEFFSPHPFSREFSRKLARDERIGRSLRMVAIITENGLTSIVGYGFITAPKRFNKYGYFGIAVADGFARRGIGSALMSDLVMVAGRRGIREVLLDVKSDNTGAIALYRKQGFVELDCSLVHRFLTVREAVYSYGLLYPIKEKLKAITGRAVDGDSSLCMHKKTGYGVYAKD